MGNSHHQTKTFILPEEQKSSLQFCQLKRQTTRNCLSEINFQRFRRQKSSRCRHIKKSLRNLCSIKCYLIRVYGVNDFMNPSTILTKKKSTLTSFYEALKDLSKMILTKHPAPYLIYTIPIKMDSFTEISSQKICWLVMIIFWRFVTLGGVYKLITSKKGTLFVVL